VQGPGGNTSVKENHWMMIKASGFTFEDICNDTGVVVLDVHEILLQSFESPSQTNQKTKVSVAFSSKSDLRASMEYEFHAVLGKYVLHTHNVYVNVVTCSTKTESFLTSIFPDLDFVFVPYVTPGYPLAKFIYQQQADVKKAKVFFLKNHGLIVHGETIEEVNTIYSMVQEKIIQTLGMDVLNGKSQLPTNLGSYKFDEFTHGYQFTNLDCLIQYVLVPDQSIFFKDKVSDQDDAKDIIVSFSDQTVQVKGSDKYKHTVFEMLNMVFYILSQHAKLEFETDYISESDIYILHGLPTEKYRQSLL
jgi:ribulose-5-phosphate 4-epimerase/fuculose-1-phosphate aldolase